MKDLGGGVLNQKEASKDGKNQERPRLRAAKSEIIDSAHYTRRLWCDASAQGPVSRNWPECPPRAALGTRFEFQIHASLDI